MSADPIDQACLIEQRDRDLLIAVARLNSKTREIPAMGICHNCQDPVGLGERYCPGPDCRDDHLARKNAEKRRGRVQ